MNVEIARNAWNHAVPLVVLVDLQVEYAALGRAYSLADIEPCLDNCRAVLSESRRLGLPIAHFRRTQANTYFNPVSPFSAWISDFRPRTNEMMFERRLPSCYSNREFCAFMEVVEAPTMVLLGLTGEGACLSTAVDGFHRGHTTIFVGDASASRPLPGLNAIDSHAAVIKIMSFYVDVVSTAGALDRIAKINPTV
jgi:nicotinamidase-related amidase